MSRKIQFPDPGLFLSKDVHLEYLIFNETQFLMPAMFLGKKWMKHIGNTIF